MPRPDYDVINDRWPVSSVLQHYGISIRNRTFKCPLHEDHTASGSVYTGKDGRERWKCHGCNTGGDSLDLVQAIDRCDRNEAIRRLTGEDPAFRPPPMPPAKVKPVPVFDLAPIPPEWVAQIRPGVPTPPIRHKNGKVYPYADVQLVHIYRDPHDVVPLIVLRRKRQDGSKFFTPLRWCRHHNQLVATGWKDGERRLFYREPELERRPDDPVLVVEGEKCADLLGTLPQFADYVVITWHGGTDAVKHHDWAKLRGRRVVFWPDADRPKEDEVKGKGWRAMEQAAGLSQPAQVRILEPPMAWIDRECGYDAADLMDDLEHDARKVRDEMEALAVPWHPPQSRALTVMPGDGMLTNASGALAVGEQANWWMAVNSDRFDHVLTYDVLDREVLIDGRPLDEAGIYDVMAELCARRGFRQVTPVKLGPILYTVAKRHPINRWADRLRGLEWDGIQRHVLAYAGVTLDPWAIASGRRFMLGWAARGLWPGWKHDGVLILEGEQGLGNSRIFQTLGTLFGENRFVELAKLSQDKDTQMQLAGKTIVELAEMTAHRAGETDAIKSMLTQTHDHYRPPYGRAVEVFPRSCLFGGSTNEEEYLKDRSGNRRYWINRVSHRAEIAALEHDLPQIAAEAVYRLTQSEPNWLSPEEETLQREIAQSRVLTPAQLDGLEEWVRGRDNFQSIDVYIALDIPMTARTQIVKQALHQMLRDLGYRFGRWDRRDGSQSRSWRLDPDIP